MNPACDVTTLSETGSRWVVVEVVVRKVVVSGVVTVVVVLTEVLEGKTSGGVVQGKRLQG